MRSVTSSEILRRAEEILQTAARGLADMKDPHRRLSGLQNLVVFGRAVTNVLQNLRSTEPSFDDWYASVEQSLRSDPLMKFFYELRTRILKRGETGVAGYTHLHNFSVPADMRRFGNPPPNAKALFIGDAVGGTGWEVEVAPGLTEKFYVDLPQDIGVSGIYFSDAPGVVAGAASDADVEKRTGLLNEKRAEVIAELYKRLIDFLSAAESFASYAEWRGDHQRTKRRRSWERKLAPS